MAVCPKCGYRLKLKDWKQTCPQCGTDLVLFDLQERLMQQADEAEVQYYFHSGKIDRMKASFAGSKLAILRIVVFSLPLFALLLPLAAAELKAPLPEFAGNIGAIELYKIFSSGFDAGAFLGLLSDPAAKPAALMLAVSAVLLAASVLLFLIRILLIMQACSPHGKRRMLTADILLLVFSTGAAAVFAAIPGNSFISGSVAYGSFVYILLYAIGLAVDIAVYRQGINVKYRQCTVGGIPYEEYVALRDSGAPPEEIRRRQYAVLEEQQREREEKIEGKKEDVPEKPVEEKTEGGGEG